MIKNIAEGLLIFSKYNAFITVVKSKRYDDADSDDSINIYINNKASVSEDDMGKLLELGWKFLYSYDWKFDL